MPIPKTIELKFNQATKHVETLEKAIRSFLKDEPYAAERVINADGTQHVFNWERFTPPPDCFGLIAGDAVHNVRSALDHLAVALAEAGAKAKGTTMSENEIARLEFPITLSEDNFAYKLHRGSLRHVEPLAKAFIESNQPYNLVPKDPAADTLNTIAVLDNTDKHRTLNVTGWASTIQQENWPFDVAMTRFEPPRGVLRFEVGAEIGRFVFPTPRAEVEVPVTFEWGISMVVPRWTYGDVVSMLNLLIYTARTRVVDQLVKYV